MSHIETLQKEISRLDGQVAQSLANYNSVLGASVFAKQLLAKMVAAESAQSSTNVHTHPTIPANSSIPPM